MVYIAVVILISDLILHKKGTKARIKKNLFLVYLQVYINRMLKYKTCLLHL